MAKLTPLWTQEPTTDPAEIGPFLATEGIEYAEWKLPEEVSSLASQNRLSDAEKNRLLDIFQSEISEVAQSKGYVDADVVAIRADLPGIDDALAKFDKVHYHDDDEVRFLLSGDGIFDIRSGADRWIRAVVSAGDMVVVPARRHHRFLLTEQKAIRCVRLFKAPAGWVPHYRAA